MSRELAKRIAGAVDLPAAGLGFGLVALIAAVALLGVAPTALALGLLALLAVD
jgi:hypothetical protein